MTNAPPHGSPGAPHLSYSNPTSGIMPRRSSYASVAAGTAAQPPQIPQIQSTSSHLPRIVNMSSYTHPPSSDQPSRPQQSILESGNQGERAIDIPGSWGKGGDMSRNTSRRYSNQNNFSIVGEGPPAFFKPSYLKDSKYLESLEEVHIAKVAAELDGPLARSSDPVSLSRSSSSANMQKMAPSHRGMTYEIIEHQPHVEEDFPAPLPSKFEATDKYGGLEVAVDGLDVKFVGLHKMGEHEAAATRSDHPIPPQCGIYYFEVSIISKGKEGMIGVGFSGANTSLEKLPGWEQDSWAYHGDDGKSFCCQSQGKNYGPTFTSGDVIGCGINFFTGCGFFTKNGVYLGNAFRDLKDVKVYPSIGMKRPLAHATVNFGHKPFLFDIDGMMSRERVGIQEEIINANVSIPDLNLDKDDICKALVAQYLSHDGYVETARAFANELRADAISLKGQPEPKLEPFLSVEEDHDAVNRQQIRIAVLDGDIDRALKFTNAYYPQVLPKNPQIYFKLRCRKFIEMMRQSTELLETSPSKRTKSINGHSIAVSDDGFEPDMDLDEPIKDGDDWDKMETEEADNGRADTNIKYEMLMTSLIQYGQELKHEFEGDGSEFVKDTLRDIFSLFSYQNPWKSPHGGMLRPEQRVSVAEGLNSAILGWLGRSESTALERLYKQTSVLIDVIGEDGGPGAFVNVRNLLKVSQFPSR